MGTLKMATQILMNEEGFVPHAYLDSEGYWTIGFGTLIDKRRGGGIDRAEAGVLMGNRVMKDFDQLDRLIPWWSGLSETRRAVLLCVAYQVGVPGLMKFKRTLSALEAGDFGTAADQMLASRWATQTPARAKRMANMVRGNQ